MFLREKHKSDALLQFFFKKCVVERTIKFKLFDLSLNYTDEHTDIHQIIIIIIKVPRKKSLTDL